jgi:hypothetical protein
MTITFVDSEFIRLEVLPKAVFNTKAKETEFYSAFFQAVSHWPYDNDAVVRHAYDMAVRFGLAALDALHVAAALSVGETRQAAPSHDGICRAIHCRFASMIPHSAVPRADKPDF